MIPLWVADLAALFWNTLGEREPFPRNLRRPIARGLPLTVVLLPGLSVGPVLAWLGEEGAGCSFEDPDRPLRACLVAQGGWGFAFVDGTDPEDEQRFSLAHELAHFLRDYWEPRRRASERLGPPVLEVFDGARPPRPEERLHALLAHVAVGFHTHLLARTPERPLSAAVAAAERDADRLAYELLAPADQVLAEAGDRMEVVARLQDGYGLPAAEAARYADLLFPPTPPTEAWLARLKNLS